MKDTEALTIARVFVNEYVYRFVVPDSVRTDQGRNFNEDPHHCIAPAVRWPCGEVLLRMMVSEDEQGWDLILPTLFLAYS